MSLHTFKNRLEFKNFVKLNNGFEPRNYEILDEFNTLNNNINEEVKLDYYKEIIQEMTQEIKKELTTEPQEEPAPDIINTLENNIIITPEKLEKHIFKIPDITKDKKSANNGLNLDIEDDKIDSFYVNVPLKSIVDATLNKEQILKKIAEHNIINDTAKIDFYKNKTKKNIKNIIELSGIFCDNVVLSGLTTTNNCKGKLCADVAKYTTGAREFYRNRELHVKIVPTEITDLKDGDLTKERINIYKKEILKGQDIVGDYKLQNIKVATADVPFKDILKNHTGEDLKILNNSGLFIKDIDYTQDVAGCIDKYKFIEYLISRKESFYLEDLTIKQDPHLRIMNDNDKKGRHCLTFLMLKNDMLLRAKFYNKFVQSMETGAVRQCLGGHVANFVNNPGKRLNDTIKKGHKYGILRMEISYYCKENTPNEADIKEDLEYLKELLINAPDDAYFYCSVENQHRELLNNITETLIIYDLTHNYLLLCRWWNSETKKINGILKLNAKTDKTDIKTMCAYLTFNKPFNMILLKYGNNINTKDIQPKEVIIEEENEVNIEDEDIEIQLKNLVKDEKFKQENIKKTKKKDNLLPKDSTIEINVRRYIKENQPLTFITDNKLEPHKTDTKNNNPEDRGLTPHNSITWYLPDKATTNTRDIIIKRIYNNKPLNLLSNKKLKQNEKHRIEQADDAERNKILKDITFEKIEKDIILRRKTEQLETTLSNIGERFNSIKSHEKLQNLSKGDNLEITAFYRIETKYGGTYIIYDQIRGITYYANVQLNKYIEAVLTDNYNIFNTRNKQGERAYYYITAYTELITVFFIEIKDIKPIERNKTAILINKTNNKYLKNHIKKQEELVLEHVIYTTLKTDNDNTFKISRDIESVDNLEEGKIYYIKEIKRIKQTLRTAYVIYLLDDNQQPIYNKQFENDIPELKAYKSNYYVEETLNKVNNIIDLNGQNIKPIHVGQIKLTPNKKRCRVITIQ